MKLFLVLSAFILAVTALPIQEKTETTISPVANDAAEPVAATQLPGELIPRQEEEEEQEQSATDAPVPSEVASEVDEEDEEDEEVAAATERATTLRTSSIQQPSVAQPPKKKLPQTSFAQEWAIVTGDVAHPDAINRNVGQPEKVLTV